MISHDIVPYTDKKLDCYQNMLVTLLHHYGCDVNLLGSVLPWRYYIRKKTNEIANCYIASDSLVESLYGYKVIRRKFNLERITETLLQVARKHPIIVNVDQYYVPHHYVHIYKKQHGQHSLLINGYNESDRAFHCVDAFPQYVGKISCDELEKGIKYFPYDYIKLEYSIVEKTDNSLKKTDEIFWDFIDSANSFQSSVYDLSFSNKAIISILDGLYLESDENFFFRLHTIFQGNWIWELDRVADWTISYLNTNYVRKMYGDEKICLLSDLIQQCNSAIVSAYRVIYKSLLTKSRVTFSKGYEKLKDVTTFQNDIYKRVKNLKCGNERKLIL